MATVTSWVGTVTDIGPMYPFVGTEMMLVIIVGVIWVAWHILQMRAENEEFKLDAERLKDREALRRVLDREG